MVIASAERLMAILHFWRNNNSTAEINVPACPIPIHHTKLVMSQAQATPLFDPQTPIPVPIVYAKQESPQPKHRTDIPSSMYQYLFAFPSIGPAISLVISLYDLLPRKS